MGTEYVKRENHTLLFATLYTFKDVALISEFLLVLSRLHNCTSTGELPHKLVWIATFDFLTTVALKLLGCDAYIHAVDSEEPVAYMT